MANRRCARCSQEKPEEEFSWSTVGKKRSSRCKPCLAELKRQKWEKDPERYREIMRRSYSKNRKERIDAKNKQYWENPEHHRERQRVYNAKHRTKIAEQVREIRRATRIEMLTAYGGRCVCCGETEPKFLTLDHTNGDGKLHRAEVGPGGVAWDLKKRGWPQEGYRLLCWNCHMAISHHGACPHHSAEPEVKGE